MAHHLWYRVCTAVFAFKALYSLSKDEIHSFMKSYTLFGDEHVTKATESKIVDYYSVLNHLCAVGQVEKMYIPPEMDLSSGIISNQNLFEEKMVADLGIKKEHHCLELGCGRGRIAAHVTSLTGAKISALNIDKTQVENARENASRKKLDDRLDFTLASFNDPLPFPDNKFDAMYQVQAFTYVEDMRATMKEIHRVLKPGAKMSVLDWFSLDAYDETNTRHQEIMAKVKPLIGAVNTMKPQEMCAIMEEVGFTILYSKNPSCTGVQNTLIEQADYFFTSVNAIVNGLVFLRILPQHFKILFDRLTLGCEAFIDGDKEKLFTTVHQIVGQKPVS